MKKRILVLMLGLVMILTLAGCGGGDTSGDEGSADVETTESGEFADLKIVLILPGSIDDQSWNASNYAGAQAADAELGTHIEVVESVPVEEFESTFTEYGEKGYNIVMSAGSQFDEAAAAVAPNYPDTYYCVINGQIPEADNRCPGTVLCRLHMRGYCFIGSDRKSTRMDCHGVSRRINETCPGILQGHDFLCL